MSSLEDDWALLKPKRVSRALDLVGTWFGRLEVIERAGSDKHGTSMWRCRCDCGSYKVARRSDLKRGKVKSCGCLAAEYKAQPTKKGLRKGQPAGVEVEADA